LTVYTGINTAIIFLQQD